MLIPRLSVAIGLVTALVGSQVPEFAQQYRQGLVGAIGELKREVGQFDADARAQGKSREQAIAELEQDPSVQAQRRGLAIEHDIARLEALQDQYVAFGQAGQFARVFILLRDFDPAIAEGAFANFEPAVPTNAEGIVSAVAGFFVGLGVIRLLAVPFRRRQRGMPLAARIAAEAEADAKRQQSIALRERMNRYTLPRRGPGDA